MLIFAIVSLRGRPLLTQTVVRTLLTQTVVRTFLIQTVVRTLLIQTAVRTLLTQPVVRTLHRSIPLTPETTCESLKVGTK